MPENYEIKWTEIARNDLDEITDFIALDSIETAIKIYHKLIYKWNPCPHIRQEVESFLSYESLDLIATEKLLSDLSEYSIKSKPIKSSC